VVGCCGAGREQPISGLFLGEGSERLFWERKIKTGWGAAVWKVIGLGLGFGFFCVFSKCAKFSSLVYVLETLFIGKNVVWTSKLIPQLLSFFVNLIFLNFFVFFENEQYQRRLNEENQ
jgi:hypothetical protein